MEIMRKLRKVSATVLSLILAAAMLTGCGASAPAETQTPAEELK